MRESHLKYEKIYVFLKCEDITQKEMRLITIAICHNLNSDNCFISFAYLLVHAIYD